MSLCGVFHLAKVVLQNVRCLLKVLYGKTSPNIFSIARNMHFSSQYNNKKYICNTWIN